MYRGYMITINKKDLAEAMRIIVKRDRDFDKITRSVSRDGVSNCLITFKLHPYIYDDFETIKDELIKAGIQLL